MISSIFNTLLYNPIYNALLFLIAIIPNHSVGWAIIILTLAVKTAISPLTKKSIKSQAELKKIEPLLKEVREKYTDKQEQSQKTMDLYREHKINPFSGCLIMLIQLPIILALYFVFYKGLTNGLDTSILYSFVDVKFASIGEMNMNFLGLVDLGEKSVILAMLAGITQFFQMKIAMPVSEPEKKKDGEEKDFKAEFAKNMQFQMRYILPGIITMVAYSISAAVALYWVVGNLFTISQEVLVRRNKMEKSVKVLD